jgi:hypothetical protein|uniref:Uncharacterized protein n=1 Tax=Siphoviridae sp. ctvxh7 TaxID=2827283 RepID=A0A8S5RA88_9CAUD|nr:MAG TPA: hypothetical protein [Siphoviridae sp. ctvxh7]DAE90573.1 MAG TPA: hypothetical protein [Caudoviricetes sp.]
MKYFFKFIGFMIEVIFVLLVLAFIIPKIL